MSRGYPKYGIRTMSSRLITWIAFLTVSLSGTVLARAVELSIPDMTVDGGDTVWLPVEVSEILVADGVIAFQMLIDYPDWMMMATGAIRGGIASNGSWAPSLGDGALAIGFAATMPLSGVGTLFEYEVIISKTVGDSARGEIIIGVIPWSAPYIFNEGQPAATVRGGSILVSNPGVVNVAGQPARSDPVLTASPNPFNATVRLRLNAPEPGLWQGMIVNTTGQVVRRWEVRAGYAGSNGWTWDGLSDTGFPVSSGVYMAVVAGNKKRIVTRITLLR
jgi:hypothetical protein